MFKFDKDLVETKTLFKIAVKKAIDNSSYFKSRTINAFLPQALHKEIYFVIMDEKTGLLNPWKIGAKGSEYLCLEILTFTITALLKKLEYAISQSSNEVFCKRDLDTNPLKISDKYVSEFQHSELHNSTTINYFDWVKQVVTMSKRWEKFQKSNPLDKPKLYEE